MADRVTPIPGIEKMHPRIARRHFGVRAERLARQIDELTAAEQFRLAADFADLRMVPFAQQVARRALEKLEAGEGDGDE